MHAVLAVGVARSHVLHVAPHTEAPVVPEQLVEITEELPAWEPRPALPAPPEVPSLPSPRSAMAAVAPAPSAADVTPPEVPAPPASARPSDSAEPWTFSPSAPVDLGIGTHWKAVAAASVSVPPAVAEPPPQAVSWDRLVHDELAARDQELGLGPGGALVTAAHEAASGSEAPDEGSATLEIVCDASGAVTGGLVTGASSGDLPRWNAVAETLVRQMHGKAMRLPPGAKGLRARLAIRIARTMPSGEKVMAHAGALPDDMPSAGRVCEGTGWSRKCVAGMPVGATVQAADLSNAAARLRAVSVRMLDAVGL